MEHAVISLSEISRSLETHIIEYYKVCLLKTNQFSTKYILQKLIEYHKTHTKDLKSNLVGDTGKYFQADLPDKYRQQFINSRKINSFDIENLNFVEATKLAIVLLNFQIEFYSQLAEDSDSESLRDRLEKIIELKNNYIRDLETEFDRLNYRK